MEDSLRRLGLGAYEIAVYSSLLSLGRAQVKAIAAKSAVPPTAVYPALRSLAQKGLVQEFSGDPLAFEAIKPSIALRTYAERRAADGREAAEEAAAEIEAAISETRPQEPGDIVSVSSGLTASMGLTEHFTANARKRLYIVGWRFKRSKNKDFYGLLRKFSALVGKGVDVRMILTDLEPGYVRFAREYAQAGVKIRRLPLRNFSISVMDSSECKITLKNPALGDRISVHVTDRDFSAAMDSYFLAIWKKARPLD